MSIRHRFHLSLFRHIAKTTVSFRDIKQWFSTFTIMSEVWSRILIWHLFEIFFILTPAFDKYFFLLLMDNTTLVLVSSCDVLKKKASQFETFIESLFLTSASCKDFLFKVRHQPLALIFYHCIPRDMFSAAAIASSGLKFCLQQYPIDGLSCSLIYAYLSNNICLSQWDALQEEYRRLYRRAIH